MLLQDVQRAAPRLQDIVALRRLFTGKINKN